MQPSSATGAASAMQSPATNRAQARSERGPRTSTFAIWGTKISPARKGPSTAEASA